MNRYVTVISIIAGVLLLLGLFAYNFLEIYDKPVRRRPSPEVRANEFVALERWLGSSGHPVNTDFYAYADDLVEYYDEDVFVIDALSFYWDEDTFDWLEGWLVLGKHLVVYYNYWQDDYHDPYFTDFIEQFGITMITPGTPAEEPPESNQEDRDNIEDTDSPVSSGGDEPLVIPGVIPAGGEDPGRPNLDRAIRFTFPAGRADIETAGLNETTVNLVRVRLGAGSVTFTGRPYFMYNNYINEPENALLSWALTGAQDKDNRGIMLFRETEDKNTFFSDLLEEGNIFPLAISILILMAVCFWGFIPRFGKVIADEESPGKPIRERFLSEALFLKKFHSLHIYLELYRKNVEQRFRKDYGETIDDEIQFCSRLAEITSLDPGAINSALYPRGHITGRIFTKHMKTIEIILERL